MPALVPAQKSPLLWACVRWLNIFIILIAHLEFVCHGIPSVCHHFAVSFCKRRQAFQWLQDSELVDAVRCSIHQKKLLQTITGSTDFNTITDSTDCLVRPLGDVSLFFFRPLFFLTSHDYTINYFLPVCSFECTAFVIIHFLYHYTWVFPALCWRKTGRIKICAGALEVLHPLKLVSQNIPTATLTPLFLAFARFETAKHGET